MYVPIIPIQVTSDVQLGKFGLGTNQYIKLNLLKQRRHQSRFISAYGKSRVSLSLGNIRILE